MQLGGQGPHCSYYKIGVLLACDSQGNSRNTSSPLNTSIAQSMTQTRQVPLSVFIQATASPPGVMTEVLF